MTGTMEWSVMALSVETFRTGVRCFNGQRT